MSMTTQITKQHWLLSDKKGLLKQAFSLGFWYNKKDERL